MHTKFVLSVFLVYVFFSLFMCIKSALMRAWLQHWLTHIELFLWVQLQLWQKSRKVDNNRIHLRRVNRFTTKTKVQSIFFIICRIKLKKKSEKHSVKWKQKKMKGKILNFTSVICWTLKKKKKLKSVAEGEVNQFFIGNNDDKFRIQISFIAVEKTWKQCRVKCFVLPKKEIFGTINSW